MQAQNHKLCVARGEGRLGQAIGSSLLSSVINFYGGWQWNFSTVYRRGANNVMVMWRMGWGSLPPYQRQYTLGTYGTNISIAAHQSTFKPTHN